MKPISYFHNLGTRHNATVCAPTAHAKAVDLRGGISLMKTSEKSQIKRQMPNINILMHNKRALLSFLGRTRRRQKL